ncbi:MAG: hypothetical protein PHS77_07350 [Gallionellaceae bacterium]|nr:hypothetical protein [Gallionellaceae bacterium]
MRRLYRALALASVAVLLASCAAWTRLDDGRLEGPDGLGLQALAGWMRYNEAPARVIALTRDGLAVQTIRIEYRPHEQAFPAIKKASSLDLLPNEAADLLFADLKANAALANMQRLDVRPYRLAGRPGFRLHARFRDERGAPFDLLATGRLTRDGLLVVFYRALSTHYFQRDLEVYERLLASVQLREP